ncbi:MAG TPA: protein-methionine-sulfoxide reductase catalytic subunit MsrP [Ideonella sp.]|uniref:protein-methionine-sulfoxide reductase catalytic subunit MsrP n=1 Tax=Ideonella sp. TaxID=1929293 RepID=UPI002CB0764E|nr:protein-methionine-sulfoxide reductase catalytic subunit MsrP [Ideonella sp.]HSI49793.1 protein-methionine-sulfoxide reductase catalytic subunit MsrP [Ideonella sp.]
MPLIRTPGPHDPLPSEITSPELYHSRRAWLQRTAVGAAGLGLASWAQREAFAQGMPATPPGKLAKLPGARSGVAGALVNDKLTAYGDVTTYNNFYEFGTDKSDPNRNAASLKPRPWTVSIEGMVAKPFTLDLDALLKLAPMEERVYRLRCVEGWSMVIPWVGYSLSEIIKKAQPLGSAKFVEFTSLADPKQMPALRAGVLDWPYVEALRMDEAMHPLAMMVFGLYGEVLPNQNGAPLRLAVPWKYGFKSAKSIVKIRFVDKAPTTSWEGSAPSEYGFYSNVNPQVDHPRWSQATERRIGEDGLFAKKRATLMFNGYESQVASLYAGMDLKKNF